MIWIIAGCAASIALLLLFARLAFAAYRHYKQSRSVEGRSGAQPMYESDPDVGLVLGGGVSTYFERTETGEHFFTNDQGERVAGPGRKAGPRDMCITGSSWVMGVGSEFEDSFCGLLSLEKGLDLACLGGGNFSLLQAVRYTRKKVRFYRPRVLIFTYFSGFTSRSFRKDGFSVKRVGERPFYVRSERDGECRVQEIFAPPSNRFLRRLHVYRRHFTEPHEFSFRDVWYFSLMNLLLWRLRRVKTLGRQWRRMVNGRIRHVSDKEALRDEGLRRMVIQDAVRELCALRDEYGCSVLIYHHFDYREDEEQRKASALDQDILRELVEPEADIHYIPPSWERRAYDEHIREHGLEPGRYYEQFKLPDDSHPGPAGNRIIADCIAGALAEKGLLQGRPGPGD